MERIGKATTSASFPREVIRHATVDVALARSWRILRAEDRLAVELLRSRSLMNKRKRFALREFVAADVLLDRQYREQLSGSQRTRRYRAESSQDRVTD